MATTRTLPTISLINRTYSDIVQAQKEFIERNYPDMYNDFNESQLGTMLLELNAIVGEHIDYGIDRCAEEAFPRTFRLYTSALRYAHSVGYDVRGLTAGSMTMQVTEVPAQLATYPIRIKAGSTLNAGGVPWEVLSDVTFPAGAGQSENTVEATVTRSSDNVANLASGYGNQYWPSSGYLITDVVPNPKAFTRSGDTLTATGAFTLGVTTASLVDSAGRSMGPLEFTVSQGATETEEAVAPGYEWYKVQTTEGNVVDNSWTVTVDGVVWTQSESNDLLLEQATNRYATEYDSDGKLTVKFGDGVTGNKPDTNANIEIEYRTAAGYVSVTTGAVETTIPSVVLSTDEVTERGPLSLHVTNTAVTAGLDRETIDHIRKYAPLWVRTHDNAITIEDYDTLASVFSDADYGAIGRAKAKLRDGTLLVGSVQLTSSVGITDMAVEVSNTDGYPSSGYIQVGTEIMRYSSISGGPPPDTFVIAERGAEGTTPATHAQYDYVGPPESHPIVIAEGSDVKITGPNGDLLFTTLTTSGGTNNWNYWGQNPSVFLDPNSIDVYVWGPADVGNGTFTSASSGLKAALLEDLEDKSVATATPYIQDGLTLAIDINLGATVYCNSDADPDTVETAIEDAINEWFESDDNVPGRTFLYSDFINYIEDVEGVAYFEPVAPSSNVTVDNNQIAVKGTVTAFTVERIPDDVPNLFGRY